MLRKPESGKKHHTGKVLPLNPRENRGALMAATRQAHAGCFCRRQSSAALHALCLLHAPRLLRALHPPRALFANPHVVSGAGAALYLLLRNGERASKGQGKTRAQQRPPLRRAAMAELHRLTPFQSPLASAYLAQMC